MADAAAVTLKCARKGQGSILGAISRELAILVFESLLYSLDLSS